MLLFYMPKIILLLSFERFDNCNCMYLYWLCWRTILNSRHMLTSQDSRISNSTGAVYDRKRWDLQNIAVTNVNLPNQTLGRSKGEELRHQGHTTDLKQASKKAPRLLIWSFLFCSLALDYSLKKSLPPSNLVLQYCKQFCTLKKNNGNFCDF